jgi:hypothetical protein
MNTLDVTYPHTQKILIDNDEPSVLSVSGGVSISGIIKCPTSTVELTVTGGSSVEIYGECRLLIIRKASGGSHLNLSSFFCEEATITDADWGSRIELSVSRVIHSISMKKASILKLNGTPQIINLSLHSGSVIEQADQE